MKGRTTWAGRKQRYWVVVGRNRVQHLRPAAGISVALHAAVIAWLVARSPAPRPPEQPAAATPIEVIAVDRRAPMPEPLDVALVDDRAIARAAPSEPAVRASAPRATPAGRDAASSRAVATRAPSADRAPAATGTSGLLAMRHGEAPRAVLPAGRWDDLDHAPQGTAAEHPRASGALHDAGGGRTTSDQHGFTAAVAPDGSVALHDTPAFDPHLVLPAPRDLGRALAAWYESDKGRFGQDGDTAMARMLQATDGPGAGKAAVIPLIGGGLEVTDWLMRRHGQDPYAAKKRAFLDRTRDERVQIGKQHRAEQLARSPELALRSLEAAWASAPDLPARKQALFALWDDCAETGDPEVVAAGEAARRLVIGFIRARLPAGSADAFTTADLAALARIQRSKAAFRPYDEPSRDARDAIKGT